jgi:hypothetical protein
MSYENPWTYNDQIVEDNIPEDAIGFVYEITNLATNRRYIGKKTLFFSKTRKVKGKKKRTKVDSDWRDYYGSNVELNEERAKLGNDKFKRQILRFCYSKGEMSYYEIKFICGTDALIKESYYNQWISCKIRNNHLKK